MAVVCSYDDCPIQRVSAFNLNVTSYLLTDILRKDKILLNRLEL